MMKHLKKNTRKLGSTRYENFESFEKAVMEEAAAMEKRLLKRGIFLTSMPILASARGLAVVHEHNAIFVGCPALANFPGKNPNDENIVLLRQLTRNFSHDSGEALMKWFWSVDERRPTDYADEN